MLLRVENERNVYVFDEPVTVLVVDDDPIQREFAIIELSSPNSKVICAADGHEALEIMAQRKVDIVLSDLHMPGLDGYGLLMAMRGEERLMHTPLIMTTTRDDMFAIDRAYELGATSFATKPVNWRLIGHQIRYVLRAAKSELLSRQAQEEAETAGHLRQNIMSLMSHETRTPLSVILGFASMISAEAHGPIARKEYLSYARNIVESGQRLFDTLSALQLFADVSTRRGVVEGERTALDELVNAALADARLTADERARVTVAPAVAQADLLCEPRLIAAALRELVRNAVRHAGPHARARIDIVQSEDNGRGIAVADDGKGLDAVLVEKTMQPFLDRKGDLLQHGAGMHVGLPIARRIAELHAGRLDFHSVPGVGTRVTMFLPATAWPASVRTMRGAA